MTLNQYRLFGAMLALGEFTVQALVEFTGCNENTVRTHLNRNQDKIVVRREGTGRPGGQPAVYKLRTDSIESLRQWMSENFDAAPPKALEATGARGLVHEHEVPLSLRVAEDILSRKFSAASATSKVELFRSAQIRLDTARAEINSLLALRPDPALEARLRVVETINELCDKELALKVAAAGAVPEQAVAAAEFIVSVCEFADDLERKGESEPAITLLKSAASTGKEVVLTMAGGYQKA